MVGKFNPVPVDGESSICNGCKKMKLEIDTFEIDMIDEGIYTENYIHCIHMDACQMHYNNYIKEKEKHE